MSKQSKKASSKKAGNNQQQLSYPFNAINSHRQMQKHIDEQRAINLEVQSEKTSVYRKNNEGLIEKIGHPGVKLKSLPGISEDAEPPRPFNEVDLNDSDDAAEAMLVTKNIPKERPREHCCFRLKQIDIYGIEPGMVIQGRPKFKSWWGVFFTLLTVSSVFYYIGMKMIFLYTNRTSQLVERGVLYDWKTTQGQQIMNLQNHSMSMEIELMPSNEKMNDQNFRDNLEQHLADFFQFLTIEVETIEVNITTGEEMKTIIQPEYKIHFESNGSPRIKIDNNQILVRGYPFLKQSDHMEETERRLQDAEEESKSNSTQDKNLFSRANSKFEQYFYLIKDYIFPEEPTPDYEQVNSVTSILKIAPNINAMEDVVASLFWQDPDEYISNAKVIDSATRAEYIRLKEYAQGNTWMAEHEIRNALYRDFMANCTQYMMAVIINDKIVGQDSDGHVVYIDRQNRLFRKILDPVNGSSQKQKIQLAINELDRSADLQFPSTEWLFRAPPDVNYTSNTVNLIFQDAILNDEWPSFTLSNPDTRNSPIPFSDSLFNCQFFLNPISKVYEKQTFSLWILDQLADIGGFIVFSFIFFGYPCWCVQKELYYSRLMQDNYRMKFNKLLMGIKDKKYSANEELKRQNQMRPSDKKKTQPKQKMDTLEPIEEEEQEVPDDRSLNSEERKEEELRRKREALEEAEIEEPMEQIDLEGGKREYEGGDDQQPSMPTTQPDVKIDLKAMLASQIKEKFKKPTPEEKAPEPVAPNPSNLLAAAIQKQMTKKQKDANTVLESPKPRTRSIFGSLAQKINDKIKKDDGSKSAAPPNTNQDINKDFSSAFASKFNLKPVQQVDEVASQRSTKSKKSGVSKKGSQQGSKQGSHKSNPKSPLMSENRSNHLLLPRPSQEGSEPKTASPKNSGTKSPIQHSPSGQSKGIELQEVHQHCHEIEEEQKPPDLRDDALADPIANPDAPFQPPAAEIFKAFVPIEVSNFQIIRLHFTPRCFFTYYQMALDRLLRKAIGKMNRELEISALMRKVRETDKLCKSYEKTELFHGLKKKYKNNYLNVLNVSLETVKSIEEEYQDPLPPAPVPYQRKKLKSYFEGPDGYIRPKIFVDPFEIDKKTMGQITKTVWKKIKQDEEIINKVETDLLREERANRYKYGKGMIMSEKSVKKPITEKSHRNTEVISPLNLTGYSQLPSAMDDSMIRKKSKNALRKNVLKQMGMGPPEPPTPEVVEEGVPTIQEGGASKTDTVSKVSRVSSQTSFGKNNRYPVQPRFVPPQTINESSEQTSVYTSNYPSGSQFGRTSKRTYESKSEMPAKRSRTPYRQQPSTVQQTISDGSFSSRTGGVSSRTGKSVSKSRKRK